jgi:NitT/TauT family transport system ATP-binding protein
LIEASDDSAGGVMDPAAKASERSAVALRDVSLAYGGFPAIERIDLDVPAGEFVSIVGPTGSGKSSLLNLVAGLIDPTTGVVATGGRPVSGVNRDCGYMFQADALLPWKSALDNVALGPVLRGTPKREAVELAREWLARVGLGAWEHRYAHELSGGQRKRVAMAQVLINRLPILLMDEPFGALDAQTRALMEEELLELWAGLGATVLFVTHDLEEAIALSDRVVLISAGPAATLRGDYRVDLPRPRQVTEARFMPGFNDVYEQVWSDLREEVMTARDRARAA